MDVLTTEQRRLNMSRIRGKDTKPELQVRRGLHAAGLRFRLNALHLPGRPDLVFPKYRVAVFVHGCFWHHHGCHLFKLPDTRREFWRRKIERNAARDRQATEALLTSGWRVLIIWECALRGRSRQPEVSVLDQAAEFLRNGVKPILEISAGFE